MASIPEMCSLKFVYLTPHQQLISDHHKSTSPDPPDESGALSCVTPRILLLSTAARKQRPHGQASLLNQPKLSPKLAAPQQSHSRCPIAHLGRLLTLAVLPTATPTHAKSSVFLRSRKYVFYIRMQMRAFLPKRCSNQT